MKGHLTGASTVTCQELQIPEEIAGDFGRMIKTPPYATAPEEEANADRESPLRSHVFDVPLKTNVGVDGVSPGRAMPIPYTAACGTCHVVNELPFK